MDRQEQPTGRRAVQVECVDGVRHQHSVLQQRLRSGLRHRLRLETHLVEAWSGHCLSKRCGRGVRGVQVWRRDKGQEAGYKEGVPPRADMDVTSPSQGPWDWARRAVVAVLCP